MGHGTVSPMIPGGWRGPLTSMVAAALTLSACKHGGDECVLDLPEQCAPLYTPTFDQVFSRTLAPTCAQSGEIGRAHV